MTEDQMFVGLEVAHDRAKQAGGMRKCALPIQIAMTVEAAQGIIDNGGLQYFYEVNFEDQCPYAEFVEAYRAIGAGEAAELLARSIALFPFSNPELHESKRQRWLDDLREIEGHEFHALSDKLGGNKVVFHKLREYMSAHKEHFNAT
jgi:hypothetical protein